VYRKLARVDQETLTAGKLRYLIAESAYPTKLAFGD